MGLIGTAILDMVRPEIRSGGSEQTAFANPSKWLLDWAMGGETDAGVTINERNAEGITAVWRSINNIAEDTAKLPIELVRKHDDGRREIIHNDPALQLLNGLANPFAPAMLVRETIMRHAVGWGNGYVEIVRNNAGKPAELWNLPPDCVVPKWVKVSEGRSELVYEYTSPITSRIVTLKSREILHIRGPGDGVIGFSPVRLFRTAMGLSKAAETCGAKLFGRGLRPSGVISHPKTLSPDTARNIRESVEKKYGGAENAFRIMLLEEGMTWAQTTIPPEDAQFLETRGFQIDEVCRIYRMQPHKVMSLARSTNNNIEHQGIEYKTDTLGAWMKRAEGEYSHKLLDEGAQGVVFEHDNDELSRGDEKTRAEAAQIWLNAGVKSPDEIRARESMNPQEGGTGKQYLVPSTMITREALAKRDERAVNQPLPNTPAPNVPPTSGDPPAPPTPAPDPEPAPDPAKRSAQLRSLAAAMAPCIESVIARNLKIEIDRAGRAAKTKTPSEWAGEFYPENELVLRGELMQLAEVMVHTAKITDSGEPTMSVNELAKRAAAKVCSEARAAISATGNLEAALEGWRSTRAAADTRLIVGIWSDALAPVPLAA